ncbi:hypothetical protein Pan216_38910 [Planctomycetes bacterium Pan216]|uniref:DUF4280 domain-containing protein n=1 Tax=Kolteria novifilia TaxID=2527975 RepID=A0A518B7R6_9BACT|nr:hypothetical protein Pan216_38910 [Planctomycetes bacterium Pan216]
MGEPIVVETAVCACTMGTVPTPLTVTSQEFKTINAMPVATIADCAPDVNITPFGTCNELTAAASGVPQPCVPAPVGTWMPGSLMWTANELPILVQTDKLVCGVGGEISVIENPANETMTSF